MADIVIPEEVWGQFLKSLFAKVTKDREELIAEMHADVVVFRARLEVARERKLHEVEEKAEIKLREVEEQIELRARASEEEIERRARAFEERLEGMIRAVEEEIARKRRAADDQIECKRRAAEDEIARLRQLERIRHTYEAERDEGDEGSLLQ
jgi:hypothetical protein